MQSRKWIKWNEAGYTRKKRAQFINRNNELCQEFSFAHPCTMVKFNSIYNSHFTGSVLWDLFSPESEMIETTWNTAVRKMFQLHRTTHRYLIEPVSATPHIKWSLINRFRNFIRKIKIPNKSQLQNLLGICKADCRSTTGANIRRIKHMFDRYSIDLITTADIKSKKYHDIPK